MASEFLDSQKRVAQIHQLEQKIKKMSGWNEEYDTNQQMLNTLRKEQDEFQKKADNHEFDPLDAIHGISEEEW